MPKGMSRLINGLSIVTMLLLLLPTATIAAPLTQQMTCAEEYTIQADDWLSKIADKYLGDMMAYPAIVEATNQKYTEDNTFAKITNPDAIEIGWKVCIPSAADAQNVLDTTEHTKFGEINLTDALGREVTFSQPPQRIVVAGKAVILVADALFMFPEAATRVTALELRGPVVGKFLPLVDSNFANKVHLEHNAGVEQIAPLKPDAVVLKSYMAEELGAPLEQLGIPVVYVDLETPEQYFRDVNTLGKLLQSEARAAEIQSFYQAKLDDISKALQGLADTEKPRVLVLRYNAKGGEVAFNIPPASWIQTTMVELSGGIPVWRDSAQQGGWQVVGFEQIAAWDANKIFVINYDGDAAQTVAKLKADAQWQALSAVQNDEIYGFAGDFLSWDQPTPRWILGLTWLAYKIHPTHFANTNMPQEILSFYEQMYGMSEDAVEAHILPNLTGDVE